MLNGSEIAQKIGRVITDKNIPIGKLGAALGVKEGGVRQAKQERFYTFRNNLVKDRILLKDLGKIAELLNLPIEYFVLSDREYTAFKRHTSQTSLHPTEAGTYLFIHRDDHELLDRLLERVSDGQPEC